MKTIADRLLEEIERSSEFTRRNYGLKLGSDFPEMSRELIGNRRTVEQLASLWLFEQVEQRNTLRRIAATGRSMDQATLIVDFPETVETLFSFLYWGIQIGRHLEQEQAAALCSIAKESDQ